MLLEMKDLYRPGNPGGNTKRNQAVGSAFAISAAFIWSTYYSLIFYAYTYSQILIFAIPSIAGSMIFIVPLAMRSKSLHFLIDRSVFITGALYFAQQFLIILSTERNGSVITTLAVLFGDVIISPALSIALRINRVRLDYRIFAISLAIMIPASVLLITYGKAITVHGIAGIGLLFGVMLAVPVLFLSLNMLIASRGSFHALAGTFFWPGILSLAVGVIAIHGASPEGGLLPLFTLIVTGVTSMGVAYLFFFRASNLGGFAITSVLQALIPPFTLLTTHFTESVNVSLLSAILIILASVGAAVAVLSIRQES